MPTEMMRWHKMKWQGSPLAVPEQQETESPQAVTREICNAIKSNGKCICKSVATGGARTSWICILWQYKKLNCQTHTHIHTYILHTILLKNPPASDHPQDEACLLSNRVGGSLNIASMQEMWLCALSIYLALAINAASHCMYVHMLCMLLLTRTLRVFVLGHLSSKRVQRRVWDARCPSCKGAMNCGN